MITVSQINIYPLKSAQGVALPNTGFDAEGMLHDRRLMAVDETGNFLTARRYPELLQVTCQINADGFTLSHPDQNAECAIAPSHYSNNQNLMSGRVWKDDITALDAGDAAATWISSILEKTSRIALWKPSSRHSGKYNLDTSFADAAPLLIVSEASMQQGCDWAGIPYDSRRFRPNIVISGVDEFEEETWKQFEINNTRFDMLDTCTRCILTTRDPDSGEAHPDRQPMKALMQKHTNKNRQPVMGMNATMTSNVQTASIAVGDELIIL